MKTKNTKVVPAVLDGMPVEVATSMLCAPKAKLTNRMRKTCRAARERVYPSLAPIRKVPHPNEDLEEGQVEYEYRMDAKLDIEDKHDRLARGLNWTQLHSHLKRWSKRRAKVQSEYLRLMESSVADTVKESRGRDLTWAAAQMELVQDALQVEIERRKKITALKNL